MKISTVSVFILFSILILVNLPVYALEEIPVTSPASKHCVSTKQDNGTYTTQCWQVDSSTGQNETNANLSVDNIQKFNREHSGTSEAVEDTSEIVQSPKTAINLQLNSTLYIMNDLNYPVNISGDLGNTSISPGESYSHLFDTVGDFNLKVVNSTLTASVKDWVKENQDQLRSNLDYVHKLLNKQAVFHNMITILDTANDIQCNTDDKCLSSSILTIPVNAPVTWRNYDSHAHRIVSGKVSDNATGLLFDTNLLHPNENYTTYFNKTGVYDYFDQINPWVSGQIVVTDSNVVNPDLSHSNNTPAWTKKIFQWYDEGKITNDELFSFVKYLIDNKIMGK